MPDVPPLTAEEILVVRHYVERRKKVMGAIVTVVGTAIGGAILAALGVL